jgi:hypothetical protein
MSPPGQTSPIFARKDPHATRKHAHSNHRQLDCLPAQHEHPPPYLWSIQDRISGHADRFGLSFPGRLPASDMGTLKGFALPFGPPPATTPRSLRSASPCPPTTVRRQRRGRAKRGAGGVGCPSRSPRRGSRPAPHATTRMPSPSFPDPPCNECKASSRVAPRAA